LFFFFFSRYIRSCESNDCLWALEDNHSAGKFYQKMGGKNLDKLEKMEKYGSKELKSIGYAWTFD